MLSYTTGRNLCGSLANDSQSATLSLFDTLINESLRTRLSKKDWWFLERILTSTSTASQSSLKIEHPVKKIIAVTVTSGSSVIPLRMVNSYKEWATILQNTSTTATFPQFGYFYNNTLYFYPYISSASETITVAYVKRQKDLSIADYTAGTITAVTNGDGTVTGSSTAWTAKMVGRFVRITDSNTANTGDGEWYEVSSITSATELELVGVYQGVSISGGTAAYTMAQCSLLPEEYDRIPIYDALGDYFTSINPNVERGDRYKQQAEDLMAQMENEHKSRTGSVRVYTRTPNIVNPNLYPNPTA